MTKIMRCNGNCKNDYQDKKYGNGMRVCNSTKEPEKNGYRCTVCLTINK
jgi:hypothetical protein